MNITLQSRFISFLNDITTHVSVRKRLVQKSSNIQTFIYYMYVILTPRWVASFLKGSLLSRTLYSIGTALSTVVNRSRFDSRRRSQSRLIQNQHWTNNYSRGSHAPYLELRQCPALPVKLRSRESNPRHAPSLLVTTPRHWPFP